jgi:hypothetical protein
MATQGIFSVIENSKVKFKVVTGNDGMLITDLKDWFSVNQHTDADELYKKCKSIFGEDNLVVQLSKDTSIFQGTYQYLKGYYNKSFEDPIFNPRWSNGTADHIEVFEITTP